MKYTDVYKMSKSAAGMANISRIMSSDIPQMPVKRTLSHRSVLPYLRLAAVIPPIASPALGQTSSPTKKDNPPMQKLPDSETSKRLYQKARKLRDSYR